MRCVESLAVTPRRGRRRCAAWQPSAQGPDPPGRLGPPEADDCQSISVRPANGGPGGRRPRRLTYTAPGAMAASPGLLAGRPPLGLRAHDLWPGRALPALRPVRPLVARS